MAEDTLSKWSSVGKRTALRERWRLWRLRTLPAGELLAVPLRLIMSSRSLRASSSMLRFENCNRVPANFSMESSSTKETRSSTGESRPDCAGVLQPQQHDSLRLRLVAESKPCKEEILPATRHLQPADRASIQQHTQERSHRPNLVLCRSGGSPILWGSPERSRHRTGFSSKYTEGASMDSELGTKAAFWVTSSFQLMPFLPVSGCAWKNGWSFTCDARLTTSGRIPSRASIHCTGATPVAIDGTGFEQRGTASGICRTLHGKRPAALCRLSVHASSSPTLDASDS